MKLCLSCEAEFSHSNWLCPTCGYSPVTLDGFTAFSPAHAHSNDGMAHDVHHKLNKLQHKSFWFRVRNKLIQDMIHKYTPNATNVLEIGCGTGFVLECIQKALPNAKLTATELYCHGLAYAKEKLSGCEFLQSDARQLPFTSEFDLIGAFDVIEHIEEDWVVIQNITKALKPNGYLMLTVPQHPWLWSKSDETACHKRRYTAKTLTTLLQQQGLRIITSSSFMFFLLPLMWMQRMTATQKKQYDQTNELHLPHWIDKSFESLLLIERFAIQRGLRLPIGGSRLIVAKK